MKMHSTLQLPFYNKIQNQEVSSALLGCIDWGLYLSEHQQSSLSWKQWDDK